MKQITKELWEKAAQAESDDSWEGQKRFIERLVDLTVEECLKQCYTRGMNDQLYLGQLKAASYIEQHFGVE